MIKYEKEHIWYYPGVALAISDKRQAEKLKEQVTNWQSTVRGVRATQRYPFYFRGYLDLRDGRAAEAIEDFKEALKRYPPYWSSDSYEDCLANAYLESNMLDEAIAEYARIIRLNPNFPLAHYHLAQAYERKGDNDQARINYDRFLQVWTLADPDIPQILDARQRLSALR